MTRRYTLALVALLLTQLSSVPASAATCTWLGGAGLWQTAAAWSCSAVPTASDDVVIASGAVTMDAGVRHTVRSLTVTGGLLVGPDSLTVTGTLVWEAGAMAGPGALLVQAETLFRTVADKGIGREVILYGQTVWSEGTLQMRDGGVLRNRGLFFDTAAGPQTIARADDAVRMPLVHNQGRWQVASAGTTSDVDITNDGTLILAAGGGLRVDGPARFSNTSGATLTGGSMLDLMGGPAMEHGGRVDPGGVGVVGWLTVRGPYPMAPTHVLDITVNPPQILPSNDLLLVADGPVQIDGRLVLRGVDAASVGRALTVVSHGGGGALGGCYAPGDVDVLGPDGFPVPIPVTVTCTESAVTVTVLGATVGEEGPLGGVPSLAVTGPNPFRGRTTLELAVPASGPARVEAFDALGRRVAVLFDGPVAGGQPAAVVVERGALRPGVYVVRLRAGVQTAALRLTVAP